MNKNTQLDQLYIFLIEQTYKVSRKYANSEFSKFGYNISVEQWIMLKRISEHPNTTQREIAVSINKDPASVTRHLDALQKMYLIERTEGDDRRSFGVVLTKKGEKMVADILPKAHTIRKKGIEGFTDGEDQQLVALLKRVMDNFVNK
jgi:DNA-binding MarR family transcriptional regulator